MTFLLFARRAILIACRVLKRGFEKSLFLGLATCLALLGQLRVMAWLFAADADKAFQNDAFEGAGPHLVQAALQGEAGRVLVPAAAEALGRGLAQQHRSTAERYGLDHNNYIGSTPQLNTQTRSWIEFYRDRRLGAQCALAQRNGHLRPDRARRPPAPAS